RLHADPANALLLQFRRHPVRNQRDAEALALRIAGDLVVGATLAIPPDDVMRDDGKLCRHLPTPPRRPVNQDTALEGRKAAQRRAVDLLQAQPFLRLLLGILPVDRPDEEPR